MQPLTEDEVAAALGRMDGWTGDGFGIARTVDLVTFPAAIAVVHMVAVEAEAANHHPDIDIRWRRVTFRLTTHDAGGRVTVRDTALAERINAIVAVVLAADA